MIFAVVNFHIHQLALRGYDNKKKPARAGSFSKSVAMTNPASSEPIRLDYMLSWNSFARRLTPSTMPSREAFETGLMSPL